MRGEEVKVALAAWERVRDVVGGLMKRRGTTR
jgi:hypothetical protein